MLNFITNWLSGPYGGKTMLVLRLLFFIVFVVTVCTLLFAGQAENTKKRRKQPGFPVLIALTIIAWIGIFIVQFNWQMLGARNVGLMRFVRTHSSRARNLERGMIQDRNGVTLAQDAKPGSGYHREYALGQAAAHVVGYFDVRYGLSGVERAADYELSGMGGTVGSEFKRIGRNIFESNKMRGSDIKLTLDARLQRKAWELLDNRGGAVVVMDARSGELLALVSSPSFDPARPGSADNDRVKAPLLNRALQGRYPPGSTFKIVMAALAVEEKTKMVFDCPGAGFSAAPGARPIRDSEYYARRRAGKTWQGFGRIGLGKGFAQSSNVYFAQLGLACPAERFNAMTERLGLNAGTVILEGRGALLKSSAGGVPKVGDIDKRMRAQLAIGQGSMVVTPLHVALWTAAIANDGRLAPPHLLLGGKPESHVVFPVGVAKTVQDLMRLVVTSGTGRSADIEGLEICGKTGTAQAGSGSDHSWFTSYNARGGRRLVVTVLVERGGYGSRSALPIAVQLFRTASENGLL